MFRLFLCRMTMHSFCRSCRCTFYSFRSRRFGIYFPCRFRTCGTLPSFFVALLLFPEVAFPEIAFYLAYFPGVAFVVVLVFVSFSSRLWLLVLVARWPLLVVSLLLSFAFRFLSVVSVCVLVGCVVSSSLPAFALFLLFVVFSLFGSSFVGSPLRQSFAVLCRRLPPPRRCYRS